MNDFRPEDFDQAFGENANSTADTTSHLPVPTSGEQQIRLQFDTADETARKRGFGVFHLQVVAFVIR